MNMQPKHLIYYDWSLDIRAGGPPGYLANLRYGLDRINNPTKYDFELWCLKKPSNPPVKKQTLLERINAKNAFWKYIDANFFSKSKRKFFKNYLDFLGNIDNVYIQDEVVNKIKTENIKMVHCHFVIDALKVINTLKRDNIKDVKVLLTSHMPEAPSLENYSLIKDDGYSEEKAQKFKKAWEYIEKRAFTEADILIFPSKEAMDPYYDTLPQFGDWTKDKDIRFYQTGAKQLENSLDKQSLKEKYNIENEFVVVYMGRHIEVKGYDILTQAGSEILTQREDVKFLIGGRENLHIQPPKNENWVELGWVNPAELLAIADVFVLPNKRTYFDLILLEVMSMGVPIIATNTGGNKSVQKICDSLIMYDATKEDLIAKLNQFIDLDAETKQSIKTKTLQAYSDNYTPEKFAQRYLDLIEVIYNDYGLLK